MLKFLFSFFVLTSSLLANAQQQDSVLRSKLEPTKEVKEIKVKEKTGSLFRDTSKLQSPRKAIYRSAIIPGWGQARNGKWWKVPLVYGGFVGIGLYYEFNQRFYKEFLEESQYRKGRVPNSNTPTFLYPQYAFVTNDQQIYSAKDFYRRNRDLAIIGFLAFYSLNLIDAYIDARLATFDVGDNLTFKVQPSLYAPVYASGFNGPV
ncbi:MAG: hypothetical protein EOO96_30485, partial [Pedobacter sp.]